MILQQEVEEWRRRNAGKRLPTTITPPVEERPTGQILIAFREFSYLMRIKPTTTVWDVKLFLASLPGFPPVKSYRLFHSGGEIKVLSNPPRKTLNLLSDVGVRTGANLNAVAAMASFAGQCYIPGLDTDRHGNNVGADLIQDGGLFGYGAAVLITYTIEEVFANPKIALEAMGLKLKVWKGIPSFTEFQSTLNAAETKQLWVISSNTDCIPSQFLTEIQNFHRRNGALYLLGDNDPYNVSVNTVLARVLPGLTLAENYPGSQLVSARSGSSGPGFEPHYIFTGVQNLFEGITIARFKGRHPSVQYIMNSSEGQPVLGIVEATDNGCGRIAVDGGFTRLYHSWDNAGSARFVKNIAGWLCALDDDCPPEAKLANGRAATKTGDWFSKWF